MNRLLQLFPVFLLASYCNAQQSHPDKTVKEKTREVPLQKFPDKGFPENTYAIAGIRMLQLVPDSTRLGYVGKGINNNKVTAIPDRPLTEYFQNYINSKFKSSYDTAGLHFLWVLKNIRISERDFEYQSKAYLYFKADAYISKDGNAYSFATTIDTVLIEEDLNMDIRIHYKNIREAMRLLLMQTIDKGRNLTAVNNAINLQPEQIILKEKQRFDLPVYTDSIYKDGVYTDFKSFLNNAPTFDTSRLLVTKKGSTVITNERDTIRPWGVCKKGQLYKCHENTLVPIEKQEHSFVMSYYVNSSNRRNNNISNGSIFGIFTGMPGAGIAGMLLANKLSGKIITVAAIKKRPPEACAVNMENGEWFF